MGDFLIENDTWDDPGSLPGPCRNLGLERLNDEEAPIGRNRSSA
jgi:hypothetical protein